MGAVKGGLRNAIPFVPIDLLPLLDAAIPRTGPPRPRTAGELAEMDFAVTVVGREFGMDSDVYRRALLVLAVEAHRRPLRAIRGGRPS